MYMHVARLAERRIFEVMVFEIGDGVRHVRFARQERLFPQRLAVAHDARGAADVGRQVADQNLRSERGVAQLGMGEEEIVHALGDMVGKFVRQREADAERCAVVADDIDAGDLGFLAGVLGEGR